jgi:transcriptional regulator with GAF, ATPase, and Fis domain
MPGVLMNPTQNDILSTLEEKIVAYGKENLDDILYVLAEAVQTITRQRRCRIYLEDLTRGRLVCSAVGGRYPGVVHQKSFPLNVDTFLVSRVYITQDEIQFEDFNRLENKVAQAVAASISVRASYLMPILHRGRSLGVLCVDSNRVGRLPDEDQRQSLQQFLSGVAHTVDQARKYHQQMLLARQVDAAKNREAALTMVKSAVKLVDNLALASVLVPARLEGDSAEGGLTILATYSQEKEARKLYEEEKLINLGPGTSLLSRYINRDGVIIDDRLLQPLFITKLADLSLQKKVLTEELDLQSLYVVPFYEEHTRRVICLVNYYPRGNHIFNEFETGLLDAHAEMAQQVIREIGLEHMEIQVLSDINDLLQEKFSGVQPFLSRILSKATELIGADTGSIAVTRERAGERWLVIEEDDGSLVGAKSKEWLKKNIQPLRIGGEELSIEQRSLSGLTAHSGRPQLIADTRIERGPDSFYKEITETIRSEITIPIISDGETIAVICLDSLRPYYFTEEHKRILLIIERLISRYLDDLKQIESLTGEISRLGSDVGYRDPKISSYHLGNIIGNSHKALEVVDYIQRITPPIFNRIVLWSGQELRETTLGLPTILITGDTGSGKEFVFNNIFNRLNEMYQGRFGEDKQLPLQKTNIAAYSGELTYSELFGHKRGAYTGAHADRKGILEEAQGGVVFLDEIGDADPKTQVQLLRFLDNGGFVRLGDNSTRFARVLLVAATNKNLPELIRKGLFREDLYFRLSELTLKIPCLNDRREDIPDLATHFLGRLYRIYRSSNEPEDAVPLITADARELLTQHHYVGNIREMRSILQRALFLRSGRNIEGSEIRLAIGTEPGIMATEVAGESVEKLVQKTARQIFDRIVTGEESFWSGVYQPFSEKRIARDVVVEVVEQARRQGSTTMPKIAQLLKVCDPHSSDAAEQKIFYRFKNFLYKTVRIG